MQFQLKNGFLMGTASAADQIEGGEVGSNWNDFYHRGLIHDGSDPAVADDHYARFEEDTRLMKSMGMQIARIGLSWSRLMPEEGVVSQETIAHYREELQELKKRNIQVLVTIHHFGDPMWFARKGGFAKRENLHCYLDLVKVCVDAFGDLVNEYITINEPNVYAFNGYFTGEFPPGHTSFPEMVCVMENMAYCHIAAYKMIHQMREARGYRDTRVSFANHLRVFDPEDPDNLVHRTMAKGISWLFQGALTRAMLLGQFLPPLRNHWGIPKGEYADFQAINYYSRSTISGPEDGVREYCAKNDLGWEIYPEGLERVALWASKILYRPIYVTENGTCDNEDTFRSRYLFDHLRVISESPLPFRRYYHWCFIDNFEWLEGESARFGLVYNDYETQKRTIKESGQFFKKMIALHGVTEDLYRKYVEKEQYNIR